MRTHTTTTCSTISRHFKCKPTTNLSCVITTVSHTVLLNLCRPLYAVFYCTGPIQLHARTCKQQPDVYVPLNLAVTTVPRRLYSHTVLSDSSLQLHGPVRQFSTETRSCQATLYSNTVLSGDSLQKHGPVRRFSTATRFCTAIFYSNTVLSGDSRQQHGSVRRFSTTTRFCQAILYISYRLDV